MRSDGRERDRIRPVKITNNYLMSPQGSVLIEMGNTKVICTATVEEQTARHLTGTGKEWITAEYSMLPGSCGTRKKRDRGKTDGRSVEIQRLIGRALRSVADMDKLGERTIWIDCDVHPGRRRYQDGLHYRRLCSHGGGHEEDEDTRTDRRDTLKRIRFCRQRRDSGERKIIGSVLCRRL